MDEIAELNRWIAVQESPVSDLAAFVNALAARLQGAGVPVDRIASGLETRHPELRLLGIRWHLGRGAQIVRISHADIERDAAERTPFADLREDLGIHEIRCRLLGDAPIAWPMLARMRAEGSTDYLAMRLFEGRISYSTRAPDGFTDRHLALLRGIGTVLALQLDRASKEHVLASLLEVYLGKDAARQVLAGKVQRGTGVDQRCALWFCDMRGFTELSDRLPRREVVALLDEVFERVGGAIADHGGEVLKFIGDAVLAAFPIADDAVDPCRRAVGAARQSLRSLETWNADHPDRAVAIGVALHVGDVLYGNVGARERLDFTVIGAAVNEVCRIEALCKPMGVPLLCSGAFAEALGRDGLDDLGEHALKGVARPVRVFSAR